MYELFAGNPDGKRPLWGPRNRWQEASEMDLRDIGRNDMDWIQG
jgi:hypothetical protein